MRTINYFFSLAFLLVVVAGCKKEIYDDIAFAQAGDAPAQLSAMFEITQDNTGRVTITPNGAGAIHYDVYFGDNTANPARVAAGKNVEHQYAEGVYDVRLVAYSVNGKTTETTQQLTVSFKAPEDLDFTVTVDANNSLKVNVTASANYETNFKVWFGDDPNEIPITFLEGETVSHTYAAIGTYQVKVVAYSGGAATTELTKSITIVNPVLLPITFESSTIVYDWFGFDGGNVTIINNPQSNGINTSSRVARMVKNPGQPWGGAVITLGEAINFSANKVFRMKVFSPRVGAKVLLKVENLTNGGINYEQEVTTTVANQWEDLAFDYNGINTSESYHKIVLIFDNGTPGDGSANFTFLFDDIRLTNVMPSALLSLPVTFDNPNATYAPIDFGGNSSAIGADPVNAANKVLVVTKTNGAQTWAGTTVGQLSAKIPFTAANTQMSVRVYSPAAGTPILLKVEEKTNSANSVETIATTTVANAWETLVFDFANHSSGTPALNLSRNYDVINIFFNFGNAGTGAVYYADDFSFHIANPATVNLPLTFEPSLTYNWTNFDGGNVTIVNNPHKTGINTSNKVGQMVKNSGQPWGGSYLTLDAPINFTSTQLKMKVFAPRVGAKVLLKVENLNTGSISFEKEVSTTVANAWEDLTFDYSGINTAESYQKVVLIFDLGTVGDGSANFTYYFDDIRLN